MGWISDYYSFSIGTNLCSSWCLTIFPCKCCCATVVIWKLWCSCFVSHIGCWISIKTFTDFCSVLLLNCYCLEFDIFHKVVGKTSHDVCSTAYNTRSLQTSYEVKWFRLIQDWSIKCDCPRWIFRTNICCQGIKSL